MACGLSYQSAWSIPFGQLMDLAAVYMVKREGAKVKRLCSDEDVIPDVW